MSYPDKNEMMKSIKNLLGAYTYNTDHRSDSTDKTFWSTAGPVLHGVYLVVYQNSAVPWGGVFKPDDLRPVLKSDFRKTMDQMQHYVNATNEAGVMQVSQFVCDIYDLPVGKPVFADFGTRLSPLRVDKVKVVDQNINWNAEYPFADTYFGFYRPDLGIVLGEPVSHAYKKLKTLEIKLAPEKQQQPVQMQPGAFPKASWRKP